MTTELDRWVKNQKIAVFHWTFQRVGGGEILASYLGKALNCKVYCMGQSKLGFEDLSYLLPRPLRIFKRVRSLEYILWSSVNIEELGDFDIIVTSGATPRAIITPEYTMHVNYLHSPPRFLYDLWNFRRKRLTPIKRFIIDFIGEALRIWDYAVDTRVDYYFVNSEVIRFRLWKYLKRDSVVLYPPIEWNKYKCNESEDFILFLSRLEPEKRVFESIEACIRAGQKIVVAGTGTLEKQVREKYESHPLVDIKGFVDEKEKIKLLSSCKAVIFPAVAEDFGIVPCLPPDTLIYTKDGVKRISEIKEGDYVLTHKGRFRKVLKVTKRWYSGELVKITTYGNEPIHLTPEHLVRVVARTPRYSGHTWTPAKDITKKDRVVFPVPIKLCGKKIYDLAKFDTNLEKDANSVWYKHSRTKQKLKRYIPITPELCRLLGYYISEGSVSKSNDVVEIPLSNRDYAKDVYNLIKNVFGIEPKILKKRRVFRVWTGCKIIARFLETLCGAGALNKRIPYDILFHTNLQLLRELVDGMWKGDGSRYKRVCEYATVSKNLAYQLKLALVRLGKRPMIKIRRRRNNNRRNDLYVVYYTDYETKSKEHGNKAYWVGSLAYYIKSVEKIPYNGYVYNLVVEEDESYVTSAFAVHNCEALASGKPVIVDNTGFPPILLNKTGFVEQNGVFKICKGGIITRGNVANLTTAVKLLDKYSWDSEYLRNFAKQFDFEYFKLNLVLNLKIWKEKFDKFRFGEEVVL